MASRKTEPEPFPVRGTPSGYRDRWEADDGAVIQAQLAEHERLLVAAREAAAPRRPARVVLLTRCASLPHPRIGS
jgi:hypothetical protein